MRQENLFSAEELLQPLELDLRRAHPAVWVRRLVILSEADSRKLLQNIPFQRGLNIVRTDTRTSEDTHSIAHDVGKTLLMRLLRFTLGESAYASRGETARILKARPNAVVIAEWVVAEQVCVVVRPLSDTDGTSSYMVSGGQWDAALSASTEFQQPLAKFVRLMEDASFHELPPFRLKGDPVGWLDVLPWLARDCNCGFRKPSVWRDRDVNPKGIRDPKQNSVLMLWVMGLIFDAEARSRVERDRLKQEAKNIDRNSQLARDRMETLFNSLAEIAEYRSPRFDEESEPLSAKELAIDLVSFVHQKNDATKSMLEDFAKREDKLETLRLRVKSLEDQKDGAIRDAATARTQCRLAQQQLDDEIKREEGPADCPLKDQCALRIEKQNNDAGGRSRNEAQHLARLRERAEEAKTQSKSKAESEDGLGKQYCDAKKEFEQLQAEVEKERSVLQRSAGGWETLVPQADFLETAIVDFERSEEAAKELRSKLKNCDKSIAGVENDDRFRSHLRKLENCYSHVLTHIFDDQAGGRIETQSGLNPVTGATLQAHGTALSAMARVIAFELSCVLASMCGHGGHPRLLMHDGPREGEMEVELFRILLHTVNWLESISPEQEAGFQYILTSAAVPDGIGESDPSVVLTLHGRTDTGRLLKVRY